MWVAVHKIATDSSNSFLLLYMFTFTIYFYYKKHRNNTALNLSWTIILHNCVLLIANHSITANSGKDVAVRLVMLSLLSGKQIFLVFKYIVTEVRWSLSINTLCVKDKYIYLFGTFSQWLWHWNRINVFDLKVKYLKFCQIWSLVVVLTKQTQ